MKYICVDCYTKVISHYDFIQTVLAYSKESEIKSVSFYEVNRNEKLENMIISKLHNDMICTCPNCNKDLILLLKMTPEDNNYVFKISLAIVDQIEESTEENNQISENTREFANISTEKSYIKNELHELSLNHDIVNEDMTSDNNQDINRIHINSQKDTDHTNSYITLQKINASCESNKGTKRKFQKSISTETSVKAIKFQKLEDELDVIEQKAELSNDYDKANITGLITFHSENDMEYLNDDIELKEEDIIDVTRMETDCINEDDANNSDISKSNLQQVCNLCGARYISQEKYKFHMERHKLNKIDKYVCLMCDKETKNENLLWDHYLHMHKSPTRYICSDCNRTFTKKPNLNAHQRKHRHSGYKKLLNVEMDEINNQTQKVITKSKRKCTVCRKLIKDPVNDLTTCASCVEFSARLIVGEEAKVISQRQYHCSKCRKHFMRQERLEFHEMRHNENMDEFICSTCGKDFSGENSLYEHYLFVHKGARPHICEVCGKSFQLKARLKEHHRKHTGEKPYQCEICGLRCMTSHALKFHKKSHFSNRHTCEICGKSFLKKQNLNEHLEKHWKKDKNIPLPRIFTCPVCNCDLPTFRMLKHHAIGIHQLDRHDPLIIKQKPLYECNECQEKFKHQMSLKAHKEKMHEGKSLVKGIFQCDICKIEYKFKWMLIKHIKTKHNEKQCDMKFMNDETLYDHVLIHTDRKPFTCNTNFQQRDARDRHKHTSTRSYQCTDCNRTFNSCTDRLNHHKKIHGNNETECPECGEKCDDMQKVRIHLNKHLGEKLNTLEST